MAEVEDQSDGADAWTWREIRLVACAMMIGTVDGFDFQLLPLAIDKISDDLLVDPAAFSAPLAAGFFGAALGTMLGGWMGDRGGRKPAILFGISLFGVMTMAVAWCTSTQQIAVVRLLAGVGLGACLPPSLALVADSVSAGRRGAAVAIAMLASPLGVTLSGFIVPHLIHVLGWVTAFIVCGAGAVMTGVLALSVVREPKIVQQQNGDRSISGERRNSLSAVWADMDLFVCLSLMGATFLVYTGMSAALSWLPIFSRGQGISAVDAGRAIAFWTASGILGNLACGWVVGKLGATSAARLIIGSFAGSLLFSAAVFTMAGLKASDVLRVAVVITGFFASGAVAVLYATSAEHFPQRIRANGIALVTLAGKGGGIMGGGSGFIMLALPSLAAFFAALSAALIPAWLFLWGIGRGRGRARSEAP